MNFSITFLFPSLLNGSHYLKMTSEETHLKSNETQDRGCPADTCDSNVGKNQATSEEAQRLSIEQLLNKSKRDLEGMVIRYAKSERDNLQYKNKIDELEKKLKRAIKDNESLANRVKILTNDKSHLTETLSAKVAQLTVLEQKNCSINNDQSNKLVELENKLSQLERTNEDLLKQIETYKNKEGELLDFSERLSMRQMLLQTELDKALEDVPDYKIMYEQTEKANKELSERVDELTHQLEIANGQLELERKDNEVLSGEKNTIELKCRRNIEELENEIKVMRRKHQIAIKELLRQMKHLQIRSGLDVIDTHSGGVLAHNKI